MKTGSLGIALALFGALFASPALAQFGEIGSGHVVGNPTASQTDPTDATMTSIFDRAFCGTNGQSLLRTAGVWACGLPTVGTVAQTPAGGRLTVVSAGCNVSTDQVAQTTLYYAPCGGQYVSVYDGSVMAARVFTASDSDAVGLSLSLASSANWSAGALYDAFYGWDSGGSAFRLCTGPAWASAGIGTSSRGTGAGTTQLALFKGMLTNAVSMTCRYGASSTFTCGVSQCSYLGTVLMGASNGTIDLKFGTAAAGGGAARLSICNQYNRPYVRAYVSDTTASWSYNSSTWRVANAGTTQVTVVSCMGDVGVSASYSNYVTPSGGGVEPYVGIGINSSALLTTRASSPTIVTSAGWLSSHVDEVLSVAGLNIVYAIEQSLSGATSFSGQISPYNQQILSLTARM